LNQIKHLQPQIVGVFYLVPAWRQVLDKNGVFFVESLTAELNHNKQSQSCEKSEQIDNHTCFAIGAPEISFAE
jgi:hypothetical protein